LSLGLAGCGNDESAVQDRNTERVQPFGYYSNENHENGGNVRILDDNDGPITEMMDHSLGNERTNDSNRRQKVLEVRDENGNPGNPTKPLADTDRNFFERDNRFSKADQNYHGHLDSDQNRQQANMTNVRNFSRIQGNSRYHDERTRARIQGTNEGLNTGIRDHKQGTNNDTRQRTARIQGTDNPVNEVSLTNQLNTRVKTVNNVQDVQTIVNGNNVIVAVDLIEKGAEAETRQKIQQVLKPFADGKNITVVTEQGSFKRIRDLSKNNGYRDEYDRELRNINYYRFFI